MESVVTDNGSNFVKAFKVFCKPIVPVEEEQEAQDSEEEGGAASFDYDSCEESDSSVTGPTAGDILDGGNANLSDDEFNDDDDDQPRRLTLPPHYRCVAHTLNLLASSDFDKVLASQNEFKKVYRKVKIILFLFKIIILCLHFFFV